ncbi:MAG: hypothetical protein WCV93_03765 [Candidatus Shapirobacteria bacterium]|jgi:hypothetical protein
MVSIAKSVLKGLGSIGVETVEKSAEHLGKIAETIITGQELLGGIKPMAQGEYQKKVSEDELRKKEEMKEIRDKIGGGRNVEAEIEEIRKEKEKEEEEKEKQFLEQIRRQREAEMAERQALSGGESTNPAKRKKQRGSALMPQGKKKQMQPTIDQLSQTSEFKGKVD